jgi:hypothetical protein
MAIPKVTKEQLAIDIARLRVSDATWIAADERRRKEFAKAFNWGRPVGMMAGFNHVVNEPTTPSWEEIFVQVGKLLVLEELKKKIIPLPFDAFRSE